MESGLIGRIVEQAEPPNFLLHPTLLGVLGTGFLTWGLRSLSMSPLKSSLGVCEPGGFWDPMPWLFGLIHPRRSCLILFSR